jgi:DNA adenine methylase
MSVESTEAPGCEPFVKWVGGKRKLLPVLLPLLPADASTSRHVEPFIGGGAMFFARGPRRALLSDVNPDLINAYTAVRDHVDGVLTLLRAYARAHSEANYYATRDDYNARRRGPLERAAQFIYLNKTCFNGLYRVNRKGAFNVPAGRYTNPAIADADALVAASACLRRADIRCSSFECLLDECRAGDFVYLDPPYEPVSQTSSFTSYAAGGFSSDDQARLCDVFKQLDKRGCKLMLSNSSAPLIRKLYDGFVVEEIQAGRSINSDASKRGSVTELVVRNYASAKKSDQLPLIEAAQ